MAFGRRREGEGGEGGVRPRLHGVEHAFSKVVVTLGIVGVGTAVAAVLGSQDVQAWIIGLVVSLLSVLLAAVLWSRSRA